MQRANFINVEIDFIDAKEQIRSLWNLNMKKHSDLVFKFRKHDFTMCFMRKQWTILINVKNRLYECSKQIRIYSKHDVQRANFINVETDFINAKK